MTRADRDHELDARVWLLWGTAASVPLLTGRHPVVLLELLAIVIIVRSSHAPQRSTSGWGWLVRLSALAIPIGVLFNLMTVHAGEQTLFEIPSDVPLIGGPVTWNAAVYGLLSGMTIVTLVAIGTTVAALIQWSAMIRLLPARAGNLAVAGSVAWSFLPQLATSWREIRETQAARGHQWRGVRDFLPIMVPLLAGGLDRSIATAEALETRGFGVLSAGHRTRLSTSLTTIIALTAAVVGLYLFAVGQGARAAIAIAVCGVTALLTLRAGRNAILRRPTHYRTVTWSAGDSVVAAGALVALTATAVTLQIAPEALRYDPYPDITLPATNPLVLLLLACLLAPALVAPAAPDVDIAP